MTARITIEHLEPLPETRVKLGPIVLEVGDYTFSESRTVEKIEGTDLVSKLRSVGPTTFSIQGWLLPAVPKETPMFKPNGTRIYVTKVEPTTKPGGLILPGVIGQFEMGKVEAIGPDVTRFQVGDIVAHENAVEFQGEGYKGFLVKEKDVLGTFPASSRSSQAEEALAKAYRTAGQMIDEEEGD